MRGGGRMATAAGPSCGPSAQGVKPPSVLRPGCCCYMQEIAPVDYWHQAHISSLGGPRHFGTGPGLTRSIIHFHKAVLWYLLLMKTIPYKLCDYRYPKTHHCLCWTNIWDSLPSLILSWEIPVSHCVSLVVVCGQASLSLKMPAAECEGEWSWPGWLNYSIMAGEGCIHSN